MKEGGVETFSDVAILLKDIRNGRHEGLAIMPVYNNYENFVKHLKLLSQQTYQEFDLMIVLSSVSDEKKVFAELDRIRDGFGFGIAIAKRKEDTGSSGGFYTGERFALENGYSYIIIADDDCFPVDKGLYKSLVKEHNAGHPLVFTHPKFYLDDEIVYEGRGIHFYSLIDSAILRRSGLHFNRMYIGADDAELWTRIGPIAAPTLTESSVMHPAGHSIFVDFERSLLYRVNHMLLAIPGRWIDYLYGFSVLFPTYLVFGTDRTRKGGWFMLGNMLLHRFGKRALMEKNPGDEKLPGTYDLVVTPRPSMRDQKRGVLFYDYTKGGDPRRLGALAKEVFGKKILLEPINNYAVALAMAVSKETWISTSKEKYLIARNGNIATQLAKILLLWFVMPFFFAIGLASLPINIIRRPDTRRYGLLENEMQE